MFKYVHHVEYLVHNRDAMMEYLEKNFGMKPDYTEVNRKGREAHYNVGKTQIQILEPTEGETPGGAWARGDSRGVGGRRFTQNSASAQREGRHDARGERRERRQAASGETR